MNVRNFLSVSPRSFKLMIYGAFSVICHLVGILLYFLWHADSLPSYLLVRTSSAMMEYSLMSIVIIIVAAVLLEKVERQNEDD
ncbi:MAG: hypothetical protein E7577_03055 [Ruminococcaceae bacterium]|nr:hypothetical protein [Oscillospiraceae bacterium]